MAHRIGLLGVAWGTLIPCVPIEGIALPLYTARVLRLRAGKVYWSAIGEPLLASVPCAVFFWFVERRGIVQNWATFVAVTVAGLLIFTPCAFAILMRGSERSLIASRLRGLQKRLRPASVV